ncbi:hypothetical protein KC19_VG007000 [Ceratodon purpureus]|uniref:Uncharacterized protein n=1 Tax=Ceratodon purpureus TaxID=3225 RepID=A0A8T0HKX6_CERPU|nr:hypothetical protein KC19_VG007000 [Ceratodon purpureus]
MRQLITQGPVKGGQRLSLWQRCCVRLGGSSEIFGRRGSAVAEEKAAVVKNSGVWSFSEGFEELATSGSWVEDRGCIQSKEQACLAAVAVSYVASVSKVGGGSGAPREGAVLCCRSLSRAVNFVEPSGEFC